MTEAGAIRFTPPMLFALMGNSSSMFMGFVTIVLPYVAIKHGMSVAAVASVIGIVSLATLIKLFWTPILDMFGTLKGWLAAGTFLAILMTLAMILAPVDNAGLPLLLVLGFAAATAAQLAGAANSALLVITVDKARLSEASGYLQGGALVIQGASGAAGLWIATHWGTWPTALFFAAIMPATWLVSLVVIEPPRVLVKVTLGARAIGIGREIWAMGSERRRRWVMLAFLTPIGAGGASYLWAAIAPDWRAGPGIIAMANGLGAAFASGVGAFVYGRFVGHLDRSKSFLGTGVLLALAALLLALLPRTPSAFVVGTLVYSALLGFSYTSYTALQFETVGAGAVATKNAVLNAIGNVPVAYMPMLLGLVHDRWSVTAMLVFEALLTLIVIAAFALVRPGGWARPVALTTIQP